MPVLLARSSTAKVVPASSNGNSTTCSSPCASSRAVSDLDAIVSPRSERCTSTTHTGAAGSRAAGALRRRMATPP
ncbi:MAG TPA: hypothetical protein VHF22_13740 [Planctomycetota bacterium]|nr:hypothetical protein [Planctomycetota bacterium]